MLEGCLVVLIVVFAYLAFALWLEQRTRPESIADAQTTSERDLWR